MAPVMPPLKFAPSLHEKVWGGHKLRDLLGKGAGVAQTGNAADGSGADGSGDAGSAKGGQTGTSQAGEAIARDAKIGESWELSDNDGAVSVVEGGPFHGQSFRKLLADHRAAILGKHARDNPGKFPLLYKFIDASQALSVQVHPGEKDKMGDPKTETWYVVDAPPEATIIMGIGKELPREEILEKLKTGQAPKVLNHIPIAKGDVLFIPAGTVHAITPGLLIYEVQQNSDTTYRLYDWDRVGADGKPRPLHLKEAATVIRYDVHQKHKIPGLSLKLPGGTARYLTACPFFALVEYTRLKAFKLELKERFVVATCIRGEVGLEAEGANLSVKRGETVLLPASLGEVVCGETEEGSVLLTTFIPDLTADVVKPLVQAGYSPTQINRLGGAEYRLW